MIGLIKPLQDGESSFDRLKNGGLGAVAMSLLEFGPSALGKLPGVSALPEKRALPPAAWVQKSKPIKPDKPSRAPLICPKTLPGSLKI